ncbi:IS630 family transposase [Deinococcus sp. HMF7620]|uniref:IS630 family transposase n=1 Tax=Deinococcus arboris TaxID=2682977 RepID=A0A7C9MAA5_9DEIO|nr:IS630 family transposase [Deinococcus arboris]MVN88243.1 IS630 family transposase [Deinococcus arboris]
MPPAWQPTRWTREQLEERRLFTEPYLRARALSSTQIAELCGVSSSAVRRWRQHLRTQGSLEATIAPGRTPRLTDAQVAQIMTSLSAGPGPAHAPNARWTCPKVRELIGLTYDVWYDVDHLSRLSRQWGFTSQKPMGRARAQDQEALVTWVETTVPELKKKVETGATLVFIDEVGFSLKPTVTRTWAPCGRTPVLVSKHCWDRVSTIGAIATTGQFLHHTHPASIKGAHVLAFLNHLLRHVPGSMTVLLDNARIHKTKALSAFVADEPRLAVVYFPPYSPELNPIESVWAYVKQHVLANFCPSDIQMLKARLSVAWRKVRTAELPRRLLHRSAS